MTYERPEALEIGSVQEVVLGNLKVKQENDEHQLPKVADVMIAEMAE